jgi:hypothetical protein
MNARRTWAACAIAQVLVWMFLVGQQASGAGNTEAPPDLTGVWVLQVAVPPEGAAPPSGDVKLLARTNGAVPNAVRKILSMTPLFRPEVVERIHALAVERDSLQMSDAIPAEIFATIRVLSRCEQPVFTGVGAPPPGGTLEILPGRGRLTLLGEFGLVRRVYLRDTVPEDAPDQSPIGNSIGHWEGETLVVRTTGLDPGNSLGIRGTELGNEASVLERIRLVSPDELEIFTTVTAPNLYKNAVTMTTYFQRSADSTFVQQYDCGRNDRSIDPATGEERFDMTPPAGLSTTRESPAPGE